MEFLNFEGLAYFKEKENSQFAPVESTTTASQAYEIGQYFWYEGKLYEATAAIAQGDGFVTSGTGANCELADISNDFSDVKGKVEILEEQVADLEENKANKDGYYSEMTVGNAEQIVSTVGVEDKTPYNFRTAGGSVDIGDREEDMVVGGTVAWNQLVTTDTNVSKTKSGDIITVNDAVAGNAEDLVVSFEPQQDLHGYDNPWPGGIGVNKIVKTQYGGSMYNKTAGTDLKMTSSTVVCTESGNVITVQTTVDFTGQLYATDVLPAGEYYVHFVAYSDPNNLARATVYVTDEYLVTVGGAEVNVASNYTVNKSITLSNSGRIAIMVGANSATATFTDLQVESGSSFTSWKPFANICPITGFTGTNIHRTKKNLFDQSSTPTIMDCYTESGEVTARRAYKIELPAGTYTLSGIKNPDISTGAYIYLNIVNADGSFAGFTYFVAGSNTEVSTTKTLTDGQYFLLYDAQATADSSPNKFEYFNFQIELGSTTSEYEPYSGTTIPVSWQTEAGTVYGGTWNPVAGKLKAEWASYTCTGQETLSQWILWGQTSNIAGKLNSPLALYKDGAKNAMCNMLESVSNQQMYGATKTQGVCVSNNNNITIQVEGITTLEALSDWLGANTPTIVYKLVTPIEYTLTAQQIALLAGTNNVWNTIGSTQMTYLGTLNEITAQNGHKYLTRVNGSSTVVNGSGQTLSGAKGRDNIFDLTQMFGSSIADYVYSLENTSAGDGVTWFTDLFPKPYYSYNAGQLMSVNTSAHKTVGFNAWDEQWELGSYSTSTGEPIITSSQIRCKNFIPVISGATYYVKTPSGTGKKIWMFFYDASKTLLSSGLPYGSGSPANNARQFYNDDCTMPSNCSYIRFYATAEYGATYHDDICINLSWDGERDGEYEAYEEHTYALDESLTLRGIPKLDSGNKLYYDGDTYEDDGTVTRKYAVVDLGTLTWTKGNFNNITYFTCTPNGIKPATAIGVFVNALCDRYKLVSSAGVTSSFADCSFFVWTNGLLYLRDDNFINSTAAEFKTAVSGIYLVYELETSTTEEADPYVNPQIVNDFGTEEYVDYSVLNNEREVSIPVGHVTMYQANLRAKLEMAPQSPDGDGDYIVRQSNGENEYVPLVIPQELPDSPTSNGTYILQATVSGGTTTIAWVSAT